MRPVQPVPTDFERVLAVGAHPDDAEFFAGGTLAALARAGAAVTVVVCTDGRRGGRGLEDAASVRRGELEQGAARLGARRAAALGFEDGRLEADERLRGALVHELRAERPDLVLGHDPRTLWTDLGGRAALGHSDHRAAGLGLLEAIYPRAASPNFYPEAGAPVWPRELWLFDTARPDWIVDVTATLEAKLDALRAHASQERSAGGLCTAALALARRLGSAERPAEGFVRLRLR